MRHVPRTCEVEPKEALIRIDGFLSQRFNVCKRLQETPPCLTLYDSKTDVEIDINIDSAFGLPHTKLLRASLFHLNLT